MTSRILLPFLGLLALKLIYLVDSASGAASSSTAELNSKVISMEDTIKELQSKLDLAEVQIKCKEDIIKEKNDSLDAITNLRNQLAVSDCQNQIKDLTYTKDKEMTETVRNLNGRLENAEDQVRIKEDQLKLKVKEIADTTEMLKSKEELIQSKDMQILELRDKVNSMTVTISHLQSRLVETEDEIITKNVLLNVKNREIIEKTESLRNKDDIIQIKEIEIREKIEQIRNLGEEKNRKENQVKSTWLTIQRRQDGSVDFNRSWADYRKGFGNSTGEFFIGLEKLHQLTKDNPHQLYIKLRKEGGESAFLYYDNFRIGTEHQFYELRSLGKYAGPPNVQDSLRIHHRQKFSTFDKDNDNASTFNCAEHYASGWWYNNCRSRYNEAMSYFKLHF
ncbi:angiopoietin-1-like [Drosophila biarmipes]|uniref:angiopoietin-1-like n=1 Tax=Drosophila biarmipes TaxID=125945 RepID=UPI0007E72C12|nr:angiopoietin-1-like [Drosophila biarmipes]